MRAGVLGQVQWMFVSHCVLLEQCVFCDGGLGSRERKRFISNSCEEQYEKWVSVFSHCRWSRCWDLLAPCCDAALRGGRPLAPICGCWTSCPPASSPCPAPGPRRAAPVWSVAATACTHARTCASMLKLQEEKKLQNRADLSMAALAAVFGHL